MRGLRFLSHRSSCASTVAIVTRSVTIFTDILILVLTWMKTYEIKRAATQAGIKANLTTLVMRDGMSYVPSSLIFERFSHFCWGLGTLYFGCVVQT